MTEYIIDWDTNLVIDTFSKNTLREEIVRCRDCKCFIPSGYCGEMHHKTFANGFCAWGERRDA